ncbi:choice-of-anchor X domain-containing protein [Tundrisphaera lichenicola]|uniref:choice-of-anchor X domain-containing protein n=1 Tax=Tundrisphaera lichenicola TaxID=2029860 RepID=UPI003EBD6D42
MIDRLMRERIALSAFFVILIVCGSDASASGRYDPSSGLFYLSYTYARLPNSSNSAQALLSAEVGRTPELDSLVAQFYQVVSDDLGKVTAGKGYLAPPQYTDDIRKADILISPDTPFTLGGGYRGGWGTLNGFSSNTGQLAIYVQSLKEGRYSTEGQRLTIVHELCHYLFGLPDEYGAQYCPLPGSPGGKGCIMDNYNSRTWPGYLCSNVGTFSHNARAVTSRDPSIPAEKSCQEIVEEFFGKYGVDKNARFVAPSSGAALTAGSATGILPVDLALKAQDKTRSMIKDQEARGLKADRRTLLRKVTGIVFDLLKESEIAKPSNLGDIATLVLESVGVPPIVPKTLELLAPVLKAEAKKLAQSLANRPGRGRSIFDGLLKFVSNPGSGLAPPPIGDEEIDFLKDLAKQAENEVQSTVLNPDDSQLLYLSQIAAKLDAILIDNKVPGAVDARDLTRKLDSEFAKLGKIPNEVEDPFKKARATLVIAPPITNAFPGPGSIDDVLVYPEERRNYNELRRDCVLQFDDLIDRDRVSTMFGLTESVGVDLSDNAARTTNQLRAGIDNTTNQLRAGIDNRIKQDNAAAQESIKLENQLGEIGKEGLIRDRTNQILGLLDLVAQEIRRDTIKNVAVLVPPGGLPPSIIEKLENLKPILIGKTDLRLDIVQVGTAPIPRQLRDFSARSDGSILTVTDQDEVGAVSQRLANDQSQGTWVNFPLQGTILFQKRDEPIARPADKDGPIAFTLFQRMIRDRIAYPVMESDTLPDETRLALRPVYLDSASRYQFVAGFTRGLTVPTDNNEDIDLTGITSDKNAPDKITPEIRLIKHQINVENSRERADLESDINRPYRESPSDNLKYQPSKSSTNVLVFELPPTSEGGVGEGWYTPVLVLKKKNFNWPKSWNPANKDASGEFDPAKNASSEFRPKQGEGLNFTFSIGTPRSNAQLIPKLIQDAPKDPNSSYQGTLPADAKQAVISAQMIVGAPVKNARVTGLFQKIEAGVTPIRFQEFPLKDDGQAPDKVKDDGVYTGVIPLVAIPRRAADYRVGISAEYQDGTAYIDLAESIQVAGKQEELVKDRAVPMFQRSTSLNFHVEGELADQIFLINNPAPVAGGTPAAPPVPKPTEKQPSSPKTEPQK